MWDNTVITTRIVDCFVNCSKEAKANASHILGTNKRT